MTMAKRLYELLILALIWLPVAGVAVLVMDTVDHVAGGARTAFAVLALLVILAWLATEYVLEALRVDTGYGPR